ncbi:hypothetical protein ACHAXR_008907 [Thalassiosira sp. AJA248-18]
MSVTNNLLDSMLTPTPGQPAEALYHSIPLPNRVRELTSLLHQLSSSCDNNNAGRSMLAAVLLRRDIGSLGGNETMTGLSSSQSVAIMGDIAEPLLSLFSSSSQTTQRRQIGHCIAELCSSLSVVSESHGREWMKSVLGRLEPGCAAMDTMYLRLLTDIAERSPVTLWSVGTTEIFSSLFRGQTTSLEQLEPSMGALTQVGIAYEKAKRVMSATTSDGEKSSEVEKALLAQFPEACTTVNSNSPPAHLGKLFLPNMLEALVNFSTQSNSQQVDVLSECTSHLSTCAMQCPSLLAGDESSLTALMRGCMSLAQINNPENDEDVTFLKLSALDVFATISAVPQIKRSIMKPVSSPSPRSVGDVEERTLSPLLQFLIQGNETTGNAAAGGDQKGVLYLCAELAVIGVDDDEQGWSSEPALVYDSESSWENDHVALHAESLLESFVENLGGASTLPSIFGLVDSLLSSTSSWKNQRAVLSILERCLAAAPVTFVPHIPATVDAALRLVRSPSSRVQYQALQLLGSLCCANSVNVDGPAAATTATGQQQQILVREKYGGAILEAVSHLIKSPCTKVASHACLSVVSYCRGGNGSENCMVPIERELIVPYVGNLLDALRSGPLSVDLSNTNSVNEGSLTVLIRAIGAVACLADATGEAFLPHYGVMSGLTACALFGLQKSGQAIHLAPNVKNTHEISMLRGSAIEAASIIGQAVSGPDGENVSTYVNDASEIMNIATTLLNSGNTDVIPMDQLLAACARIAAVMGSQYVQFMPSVLPHILKRATEKLEVSITDNADNADNQNEEGEDGVEGYTVSIPGMGAKKVKINTSQLEEKAQSARALYEHARALGKEFCPFVEASATAFLPLVHCEYSGDVRSTSSQALCQVFKAACLGAAANDACNSSNGPAQALLPLLGRALTKQLAKEGDEDDIENRYAIADALSEVMWDAYEHKAGNGERVAQIAVADAREIVRCLMSLIQESLTRRSTLLSETADYSFDNDEIARCEDRAQAESEYLTHLVDSVGYQLKSLGESFAPIFAESVAGPLGQLLTTPGTCNDARAKLTAVCLFDDCVEHCGSSAANTYAPMLLEGIKDALSDQANEGDFELKRASVYGIAQVARKAPKSLSPAVGQELLMKVYNIAKEVETASKEDMEHVTLVENSVSAMASLALLHDSPLRDSVSDKRALMNVFLSGLPLAEDFDEAQVCHDGLCDLVESNMINVQTEYSILIRIIGKVLALVSGDDEVASQETCSRLVGVFNKIQQTVDGNSIQAVFSMLDPDSQQALVAAMQ